MPSEAVGHVAKQLIADVVAVLVVDGFQVVHVHERGYELSVGPARAVDFALELLKPDAPPAGTGELVGPRGLAVVRGLLAVVRRALAPLSRAGTKFLRWPGVPVDRPGAAVELKRFLVANGRIVVAPRRELVALMCCSIALDGCLVAKASGLQPLSRRFIAYRGGSSVRGRVDAVLAAPIGGGLVVI